jgi:WD40 repeat protein
MPAPVASLLHPQRDGFGYVFSLAWSPCGDILATGDYFGVVRLWNTSTWDVAAELRATDHEKQGSLFELRFSPRGDRLVALHDGYADAWNVESRRLLWETVLGANPCFCDSDTKVIVCSWCRLLDAVTGEWIHKEGKKFPHEVPVGITSNKSIIVTLPAEDVSGAPARVMIGRDAATLDVVHRWDVPPAWPAQWVRDAMVQKRLETRGIEEYTHLDHDLFGWNVVRRVPGSDFIIGSNFDGNDYAIDISDRAWRLILTIRDDHIIAWSPGRQIMALSEITKPDKIQLARASAAEGLKESLGWIEKPVGMGTDNDAAFSPDGRLLAIASNDPVVRVFSLI